MELHQKSGVSPLEKPQGSHDWLTPEQKQKLHDAAQAFNEHALNSPLYQEWQEKFREAGFKVSRMRR
jgi:hypothetical protein